MVRLLIKHDLGIKRVMQNNNFSGKPCPWALRLLGHWNDFLSMILIEKYYQKKLGDVELNFTSLILISSMTLEELKRVQRQGNNW